MPNMPLHPNEPHETRHKLSLKIPASSSNLGPGFDCLSLALALYNHFNFELLDKELLDCPRVSMRQDAEGYRIAPEDNLVLKILKERLAERHDILNRLRITITAGIPARAGLGSSGTAALAASAAAMYFLESNLDLQQLLDEASTIEGHPDNVAASLSGSLVAAGKFGTHDVRVIHQRLNWPEIWEVLVLRPQYTLETSAARAVLPHHVPFEDAVCNLQNLALLISGVTNADEQAMKVALHDSLHQPYRSKLMPELAQLRQLLADSPAMGCVLSGAGPSVLILTHRDHKTAIKTMLDHWAAGKKDKPDILGVAVDRQGLVVMQEALPESFHEAPTPG